jgi:hypothetical protein
VSSEYQQGSYLDSLSATEELKPTQKNQGHHENGSAEITEKGIEAYWMHGGPEQVHIKARRERHAILQIAQKGGQISVDHRGIGSSRGTGKVPDYTTSTQDTTPNQPAEDLLLYISYTTHVVSTTLVVERAEEGHTYPMQHPVYFISEVLGPSKTKYPPVQKLLYAILLTAHKLRHYFDDHKVIVVIRFPIGDILHNKEVIGMIVKWACELGAHDIEF